MLGTILNTLAPVFLVIVLGWVLTRRGFLTDSALRDLNRLTYWVGLPCMLTYRIAGASPEVGAVADLLLVCLAATVLAALAAFAAALALRLPSASVGAFIQGVFRGNLAFIGLPVVVYASSAAGTGHSATAASALLAFGPLVVFYNVLAVAVLLLFGGGDGLRGAARTLLGSLLRNPILIACLLGLALSLSAVELPVWSQRSLAAVGQMALPLALICIGGTLSSTRIQGRLGPAITGSVMKTALVPLIGFGLAAWVGLSEEHMRIALILLACPTASVSYVLTLQLKGDAELASTMIVISNLLAVPAMMVVLALPLA